MEICKTAKLIYENIKNYDNLLLKIDRITVIQLKKIVNAKEKQVTLDIIPPRKHDKKIFKRAQTTTSKIRPAVKFDQF